MRHNFIYFIIIKKPERSRNRKNSNILFAVLPLGLAACGGGSGGDNPTVDNKPQQLGKTANYIGAIFMAPANQSGAHETVGTNDSSNLTLTTSNGDRFILPRTSEGANQRGNMLIYGSATGKDGHFTAPDNRYISLFRLATTATLTPNLALPMLQTIRSAVFIAGNLLEACPPVAPRLIAVMLSSQHLTAKISIKRNLGRCVPMQISQRGNCNLV